MVNHQWFSNIFRHAPYGGRRIPPPIAPSTCALFYIQLLSQNVQSHLTKIKNDESSICAKTKQQQLATKPAVWPKHLNICNLNNNEVYIGQQNKNKCRHLERSMMIIFLLETAQKQVVGLRSLYSNYTCGCNEPVFHFRAEVSRRYCIEGISHTVILGTAVWEVFPVRICASSDTQSLLWCPNHSFQWMHLDPQKNQYFPSQGVCSYTSSFRVNELILSARWGMCLSLPWSWRFTSFSFPNMSLR